MLLTEWFPPMVGGSPRWYWEVYRRLPREEVAVAAGACPGDAAFDRTHDLRVTRLPLALPSWGVSGPGKLRGYWSVARAVRRLARRENVRAVACGRALPEGLVGLALRYTAGLPYACFSHGEELTIAASSREFRFLARRTLAGARLLIANSRNTARLLTDDWGVPAAKVRVVYPGADTGYFVPAARDPAARADLGWGDRPVVLTAGRLQRRKGHDTMIRALAAVRRAVPDVLYAIAGDGEERQYLEEVARAEGVAGHVQFLGPVDDGRLLRCYQQCDLFVLANRQIGEDIEGFGMVLVEAQACGKPVVAGASGGTADTMSADTGVVVPCETPDRLAGVVADLLADPDRRARMGAAARPWAVGQFDWGSVGGKLGRLLRQLAARAPEFEGTAP